MIGGGVNIFEGMAGGEVGGVSSVFPLKLILSKRLHIFSPDIVTY